MATLKQVFSNTKLTENGDIAYSSTGNHLVDILFMTEYFQNHLNEVALGNSDREKLFSMFVRDPRHGLGRRDLGRRLMKLAGVPLPDVLAALSGNSTDELSRDIVLTMRFPRADAAIILGGWLLDLIDAIVKLTTPRKK